MNIKFLPKLGLVLFGLFLAVFFIELLSILIIYIYQTKQELINFKSFTTKHDITILALGESTTQGGGANSWPNQLEKILNGKHLGHTFSVINQGQAGITTDQILNRLDDNLNKYHPDIVISMMGINDAAFGLGDQINHTDKSPQSHSFWDNLHTIKLFKYLLSGLIPTVRAQESIKIESLIESGRKLLNQDKFDALTELINKLPKKLTSKKHYLLLYGYYTRYLESQDTLEITRQTLELTKQAALLWPDEAIIYRNLGELYFSLADFPNALKAYEQALELNPSDDFVLKGMGMLYYGGFSDYDKSIAYLQKAVAQNPDHFNQSELIRHLAYMGKLDQAYQQINKILAADPKNISVLFELERLYRLQNMTKKADEVEIKILGINTATSNNYQTLARTLKEKRIKLIAVQYPIRSIRSLKAVFDDQDAVYVDNEVSFKQVVAKDGYDTYFIDRFGGDFGHATKAGNFLLASNIARAVEGLINASK